MNHFVHRIRGRFLDPAQRYEPRGGESMIQLHHHPARRSAGLDVPTATTWTLVGYDLEQSEDNRTPEV